MRALPFELTGVVIQGKQLGSRLGFPTANLYYDPATRDWPAEGVYVGVATVEGEGRSYAAILNQGRHPTTPLGVPTVEAHLLKHPDHALYGRKLTLSYRAFLRGEVRFDSLEALRSQLAKDRQTAVEWAQAYEPELLKE